MTRATYNATENTLTELPGMEKPVAPERLHYNRNDQKAETAMHRYYTQMIEYNKAVAACRTIPCHESARSLWKDKQKVEEGKDYEVRNAEADIYSNPGTKVKALFENGKICHGSEYDQEKAMKYLSPDVIYELDCTDVGSWYTDFYLREFPKVAFNSVHFVYPEPVASPLNIHDDLWQEVFENYLDKYCSLDNWSDWEGCMNLVKKHFDITRKF